MKKILAVTCAAALSLSLAACGSSSSDSGGVKVGDYVEFGKYNWEVLDIKGGDALVLSERILEHRPYHGEYVRVTWAESDIRAYLNGDFLSSNFSGDEIELIKTVEVENADNPWDFTAQGGNYKTLGGENTEDKIFLLSLDEVVKYMGNDKYDMLHQEDMGKSETKLYDGMANARIAYDLYGTVGLLASESGGQMSWALRSPGSYSNNAAFVGTGGDIRVDGYYVDDNRFGIRPAMWIKNVRSLKKSVIECEDPECEVCAEGTYTDNPSPDAPGCPVCKNGGECNDKIRHNRIYHQWKYPPKDAQTPEKLEAAELLRDTYDEELNNLRIQLMDAVSIENDDGRLRKTRVISEGMYEKMSYKLNELNIDSRPYSSYDDDRLDKEMESVNSQLQILQDANSALESALKKASDEAVTFEEDRADMFKALGEEALRYELKKNADNDEQRNTIDGIFGDNKVFEWAGMDGDESGTMDSYFQRVFFD